MEDEQRPLIRAAVVDNISIRGRDIAPLTNCGSWQKQKERTKNKLRICVGNIVIARRNSSHPVGHERYLYLNAAINNIAQRE